MTICKPEKTSRWAKNLKAPTATEPKAGELVLVPEFDAAAHRKEIAQVTYRIWLERADRTGSPEQDWQNAEMQVRAKYARNEINPIARAFAASSGAPG